ncbi:enkurin-like [Uranotaenia lowii]|uniref:enkurin-like n=1 Tax=Uranotaenia lowii TaxID=190385 RepID=UPI002478822F|nr:enkurin-like [Uranotaenia lowii]
MSVINIYYHNENIYNVEKKPPERPPKPPLYHSRFENMVRCETKSCKDSHRTMGYAKVPQPNPEEFLKKNGGVRYRATKSAPVRLCSDACKPPVPKKNELECGRQQVVKIVDHKMENIKKATSAGPKQQRPPRYADTRKGDFHDLKKSGLVPVYMCQPKYGKIPCYLERRKRELEIQKQAMKCAVPEEKSSCKMVTQEERLELLKGLKKNWEKLQQEYQSLPLLIDTVPKMMRKAKLEKGLKELEKDILMLENTPVIYVFDDE